MRSKPLRSEGRGREFESRRARQWINKFKEGCAGSANAKRFDLAGVHAARNHKSIGLRIRLSRPLPPILFCNPQCRFILENLAFSPRCWVFCGTISHPVVRSLVGNRVGKSDPECRADRCQPNRHGEANGAAVRVALRGRSGNEGWRGWAAETTQPCLLLSEAAGARLTRWSNSGGVCCNALGRYWHFATVRCDASIWSLLEA